MEIYKNLNADLQAMIRSYIKPVHPCATIIKNEFEMFFESFSLLESFDELEKINIDISDLILLTYFI